MNEATETEAIEQYVDELYAIHKEAGERMEAMTRENGATLSRIMSLEKEIASHVAQIRWLTKFYTKALLTVLAISFVTTIYTWYQFKSDFDSLIKSTYLNIVRVKELQQEQNRILEELKVMVAGTEVTQESDSGS